MARQLLVLAEAEAVDIMDLKVQVDQEAVVLAELLSVLLR